MGSREFCEHFINEVVCTYSVVVNVDITNLKGHRLYPAMILLRAKNGDLISLDYAAIRFPKICENCGVKRLELHELRHSNIGLLIENGASMKEAQ